MGRPADEEADAPASRAAARPSTPDAATPWATRTGGGDGSPTQGAAPNPSGTPSADHAPRRARPEPSAPARPSRVRAEVAAQERAATRGRSTVREEATPPTRGRSAVRDEETTPARGRPMARDEQTTPWGERSGSLDRDQAPAGGRRGRPASEAVSDRNHLGQPGPQQGTLDFGASPAPRRSASPVPTAPYGRRARLGVEPARASTAPRNATPAELAVPTPPPATSGARVAAFLSSPGTADPPAVDAVVLAEEAASSDSAAQRPARPEPAAPEQDAHGDGEPDRGTPAAPDPGEPDPGTPVEPDPDDPGTGRRGRSTGTDAAEPSQPTRATTGRAARSKAAEGPGRAVDGTPRITDGPAPRHAVAAPSEPQRSFGRSLGWAAAGTLLPGLGLTRTAFTRAGVVLLALFGILVVAGAAAALWSPTAVLAAATDPITLTVAAIALAAFGVIWAVSIAVTHLSLRPRNPAGWQRAVGGLAVAVLTAGVLLPSMIGARTLYDTSTMLTGIFGESPGTSSGPGEDFGTVADPWANKPRLNVLILGGDSGQNRADAVGARTDTVILASINTKTGDTVLFSLPRQTQRIPFPDGSPLAKRWPKGFTNGVPNDAEYFLNAIYHNVPIEAPDAIPAGVEDPGAYALKEGVGTALGLPVDYYAMINMDGFIEFINALGGITVNINSPVPVGGKTTGNVPPDRWLPPGPDQKLNGMDALWYARGRYGAASGDYDRMARQRCVVQAVAKQANPTTVLTNYEALSKAGRNIVATDAPTSNASALLALALKVKDGTMTSVSFENDKDGFSTVTPHWDVARERVQAAINPPPPTPAPAEPITPSAPASSAPATSAPASEQPSAPAEEPQNNGGAASVADECAYNPR